MKNRINILYYSLFVLFLLSKASSAQQAGKQVPIATPATLTSPNALLYLPWDYDISGKKYPLILFGHGSGESSMSSIGTQGLPGIITQNNPPYALLNGDTVHFIVLSITGQIMLTDKEMSDGAKDLIRRGIRIDTNRVYVTGLSAGANKAAVGYISHQTAQNFQPAAASVPMSYTRTIADLSNSYWVGQFSDYAGKGLWDFVGALDKLHGTSHIPVAQAIVDSVNSYSTGNGRITIYPNGHCCWMTYYDPSYRENINGKMMNIYEWMLQYSVAGTPTGQSVNELPLADAGKDQIITLPTDSITFNGSASSDPDGKVMHYQWTKTAGPENYNLDNDTLVSPIVRNLQNGTYTFTLTVTDDSAATASDQITVRVNEPTNTIKSNQPPFADAGADQTITLPVDSVDLVGSASSDTDGQIVHYQWTKTAGPDNYAFDNDTIPTPTVHELQKGTYTFSLTVTDDSSAIASDDVNVVVSGPTDSSKPNQPPVASAGADQNLVLPVDSIDLVGSSSSDLDGQIIHYQWAKTAGPDNYAFNNDTLANPVVNGLQQGTYVFTLTVTDNSSATSSDEVIVTVNSPTTDTVKPNLPPVANAGTDQTILLPLDSVALDASGSVDSDGTIISYEWTMESGPSQTTFNDPNAVQTTVSGLQEGTYVFNLTVRDSSGAEANDQISIIVAQDQSGNSVNNGGPVADAGDDITTTMPLNKVFLDGSRTTEKNKTSGHIFYHWEKIAGPEQYFIKYPDRPLTELRDLVVGVYTFKLTIHINSVGQKVSDIVKVTVNADAMTPGDISYTANDHTISYNSLFQYGTNTGSYGNGWDDAAVVSAAAKAGVHSIRLPLPEYFVERYNYDIRTDAFNHYTHQLGMQEITLFVGQPSDGHRDHTIYPTSTREAATFDHLYEPIWDNGENGTPINENNYFANYIYNLLKRYGKDVRFWEIVNEPDITGFWDNANKARPENWWDNPPNPGALLNFRAPVFHYIRMLRIAYEVIKKFDPDDFVAPGGIGNPAYLDALLRYTDNPDQGKVTPEYPLTGGAYFDVVSFHCYPAYFLQDWDNSINGFQWHRHSDRASQAVINLKNSFDSVLVTRGYTGIKYPKKLFIVTETNIPQKSFGTYFGSVEAQRNFIIKTLVSAQKNDIRQLYIYTVGDNADYTTATSAYQLMGLYENLTRDKPGQEKLTDEGKAYKTTSMLLYGWQYDSSRTHALGLPNDIDGAAFRQGNEYRYVLWAKTHIDQSEEASAKYSFPSSFDLDSVYRYEWNYSVDPNAKSVSGAVDIMLSGAPSFFSEGPVADSVNRPPVADAGNNQTITLPNASVTLDASASSDIDGSVVYYRWTKTAGPSAFKIDSTNPVMPQITGLVRGVYTFTVTVTDNLGATSSDNVIITVNQAANQYPIANAGVDQTSTLPNDIVQLDGSASFDPDGTIKSYHWTKKSGPSTFHFSQASAKQTKVSDLIAGTYIFTLTVTDDRGAHTSDDITVQINAHPNKAPLADPGKNITITLPTDSAVLNGSASHDPDGRITKYSWTQQSGPSEAVFGPDEGARTGIFALEVGTYVFTLTVTDDQGKTGSAQIEVTVRPAANQAPLADAGGDQTIILPRNSVTLSGIGSSDRDGRIVSFHWSKTSGPSSFHIAEADAVKTQVENLTAGTYLFTLTVKDNRGATAVANVNITVRQASNRPPIADAGPKQEITLPNQSVTLDGSASTDPDDSIATYHWIQKSGSKGSVISHDSSAITTISHLKAETYIFTLIVTDNKKATDSADVIVTVHPATAPSKTNEGPVANAGGNQIITLPLDSATLDGSASRDPDGSIVNYRWVLKSGPNGSRFANDSGAVTKVLGLKAGKYVFALTVTDDSSASTSDNVSIMVKEPSDTAKTNRSPVADAGADQAVTQPLDSVKLDGSGSSDPDGQIEHYQWEKASGPDAYIDNDTIATPVVNGLQAGTYVFKLTVTDDSAASASDEVTITVKNTSDTAKTNRPPMAEAGADQVITLPLDSVKLNGSGSNDADGQIEHYQWEKTSGPDAFAIDNDTIATPVVNGLQAGTYVFKLTVTDDSAASASDEVTITVKETSDTSKTNRPPVAEAGADQTITLPLDSVKLDGSGSSDLDGQIVHYQWEKTSGPDAFVIDNDTIANPVVSGLQAGTYIFKLTVLDDFSTAASNEITIVVKTAEDSGTQTPALNQGPVANAGHNRSITLPIDSVMLNGSASQDPDGSIIAYHWSQRSGPQKGHFSNAASKVTMVNGLKAGQYVFTLTVTDDSSAKSSDNITIIVNEPTDPTGQNPTTNRPPIADAGLNQAITLPEDSVVLDGSASSDTDGSIISYHWTLQSGSKGSHFSTENSKITKVKGLKAGKYVFELTVTDDSSASASAVVTVTVRDTNTSAVDKPGNEAPVAQAGQNQTIQLPKDSVILNGLASKDPDGEIVSYRWKQKTGTDGAILRLSNAAKTVVSNLVQGNYVFTLTVTDDDGATDTDQISITVNPPANQRPSANAGADQTIALPLNTVTLNGSSSTDPDGVISSYHWSQQSGPDGSLFNNPDTSITTVSGLRDGVYVFTLTVADHDGATDSASIIITVTGTSNHPPVADAGEDILTQLPQNNATLDGRQSYDPDGHIVTYSWESVSGPSQVIMTGADSSTCFINGLEAGVYGFKLTVTDDRGSSSSSEISVYVNKPKDTSELRFRIYPNPVHDILHVAFSKEITGIIFFRIVDMNGKIMRVYNYGRLPEHVAQTLDVSGLAAGIYLIQLIEDNQLRDVKKMVKY